MLAWGIHENWTHLLIAVLRLSLFWAQYWYQYFNQNSSHLQISAQVNHPLIQCPSQPQSVTQSGDRFICHTFYLYYNEISEYYLLNKSVIELLVVRAS